MQHSLAVPPDIAAAPVTLPSAFRALNGDHIGTEISQRLDAHGAQKEMVETDHADALKKVEHQIIIIVEEMQVAVALAASISDPANPRIVIKGSGRRQFWALNI